MTQKQAREFNRNKSFETGAQWADEHPKNMLHDVPKLGSNS